jgi:hypothetical protein
MITLARRLSESECKRDQSPYLVEQCTKVSGKTKCGMAMENKSGLMDLDMKEIGRAIRLTDLENYSMQMVISMKENGKTIKPTVKVPIHMRMVLDTRVTGRTISNMDTVQKHGLMGQCTRASITKARRMAEAS